MKKLLTCALLCALIWTACGAAAEQDMYNTPSSQEVTIGVAYPEAAICDETYFDEGLALAVADVNAAGGVLGKPLATLVRDDMNNATVATQIAQSFIDRGIGAVIGHWSTNVCYMVEDVYEDAHVAMITPNATGANLYDHPYDYIFRMISTNEQYVEAIAEYARAEGLQKFAVYYSDDIFGSNFASTVETVFSHAGLTVVDRVNSLTDVNRARVSDRWRAFGCDGVVIAASMPEAADAICQIREMREVYRIFGADTLSYQSLLPAVGNDTTNIYHAIYDESQYDPGFVSRFKDAYGAEPDFYAINAYQSVMLLRDAMEATQSVHGEQIAEYIRSLSGYQTVSATLTYNKETREFDGQPLVVVPLPNR